MRRRILKRLVVFAACGIPLAAMGWGGRLHMDISRAAARGVPDEMAAWRAYDRLMAEFSIHPDLWKEGDRAEGYRHYLDAERYAPLAIADLPGDPAELDDVLGRAYRKLGHAPWVILDLQRQLAAAMATNDWLRAARVAAAQGHYVADLHQPLHVTENFDGQKTGQHGLHMRWELEMPGVFWRSALMPAAEAKYLDEVWPWMTAWVEQSHQAVREILDADLDAAERTGHNLESQAYYQRLWQATGPLFITQAHRAACALASLWYTAWVDAGRPAIPPPPESLPETSIWKHVPEPQEHVVWPFMAFLVVLGLVIVVLSILRRPRAAAPKP